MDIWIRLAFYVFAAIAVVASLGVVGQRNPMHSVMLLIVSFGALAGLYVLLDAPFTAVTQIIIYAGAIMVLFLFVVMLLNVPREEPAPVTASALLGPTRLQARRGAVGAARRSRSSGRCRGWASRWFAQDAGGAVGQLGRAHRQRRCSRSTRSRSKRRRS